jgi:uncharacterized protein (DUF697 family)
MSNPAHLSVNRRLILSRALLAGTAGLVPVPYIDDLLAGAVRSSLIRRLAGIRQLDIDANAVELLAHPRASQLVHAASIGAIAVGGTRRIARRLVLTLVLVRRVDEAVQTFLLGTLFDHYASQRHVGAGLDGQRALRLRNAMDAAIRQAHSEVLTRTFRNGLRKMGAIASSVPRGAFSLLGRIRARAFRGANVETLDDRLDAVASSSYVQHTLSGMEGDVSAIERSYLVTLLDAFDRAWQNEDRS